MQKTKEWGPKRCGAALVQYAYMSLPWSLPPARLYFSTEYRLLWLLPGSFFVC